jgi:hypothetical protein
MSLLHPTNPFTATSPRGAQRRQGACSSASVPASASPPAWSPPTVAAGAQLCAYTRTTGSSIGRSARSLRRRRHQPTRVKPSRKSLGLPDIRAATPAFVPESWTS